MNHGVEPVAAAIRSPAGVVYYGWWVVAAVFVAEMFAIGSTSYAFGMFVIPVGSEFDLPRATTNTGLVLILLGMGLSAPLVGRLLDRFPAQWVLTGGALVMGVGLIGIGLAQDLWLIAALLLCLVGPGAGAIGPLSAATIVSRWFQQRRGRALGITSVATSLGGAVLVPVIGFNLGLFGWRGALLIQGAIIIVVVAAIALWLVRDSPDQLGLGRDDDPSAGPLNSGTAQRERWRVRALLRDWDFWCITLAVALTFAVSQSLLATLVPYAIDMGIMPERAAWLISVLAISSILGKLFFGAVADRFDKRWLLLIVALFIVCQLAVLLWQPSFWALLLLLGVTGLATGGELPVWAALVAERFGTASYGVVMGCMNLLVTLSSLVAIRYSGKAYDVIGSYDAAFIVFILCAVVACVCVAMISPRRSQRSAAPHYADSTAAMVTTAADLVKKPGV